MTSPAIKHIHFIVFFVVVVVCRCITDKNDGTVVQSVAPGLNAELGLLSQ